MSITQYKQPPAAHPLTVVFRHIVGAEANFNYRINMSGTDYNLYANNDFKSIPHEGDVFGIVEHVVRLAQLLNSGATLIRVESHSISVIFSAAIAYADQDTLLRKAIRAAGVGIAC